MYVYTQYVPVLITHCTVIICIYTIIQAHMSHGSTTMCLLFAGGHPHRREITTVCIWYGPNTEFDSFDIIRTVTNENGTERSKNSGEPTNVWNDLHCTLPMCLFVYREACKYIL